MEQQLIGANPAIKNLLDDPFMIGKHRPIVSQWFQKWVDEYMLTKRVETDQETELVAMELKAELLRQIEDAFVVTEEKVSLKEGWRNGTPIQKEDKIGKDVTVKFYGFRQTPKEQSHSFGTSV